MKDQHLKHFHSNSSQWTIYFVDSFNNTKLHLTELHFNSQDAPKIVSFSVIPRSVSGLSTCGKNEIQMRLGFEHQTCHESQEGFTKRILKEELRELRKGCHSVCCRMCGASILSPEM